MANLASSLHATARNVLLIADGLVVNISALGYVSPRLPACLTTVQYHN
jgi:hypothetical protein